MTTQWLYVFGQGMLLLPAMLFCALPLRDSMKYDRKKIYGIAALACVLWSAATACLNALGLQIELSLSMLLAMGLTLLIAGWVTDAGYAKLINVFINALALLSLSDMAGSLVDSLMLPSGMMWDTTGYSIAFQWLIMLALLGCAWPFLRGPYRWLIKSYHEENVWRIAWLLPALLVGCNLAMLPRQYATLHVGRVFGIAVMLQILLLLLLLFYNGIFYYMARRSVERAALERRASLLEIQAAQYTKLKNHMDQTAQQRHDFRHSIRLIDELAKQGKLDEVRHYVSEYTQQLDEAALETYCQNSALNAMLGYYAAIASQNGITAKLQIALPETLPIPETELCGLMGNLMENAIDACARLAPKERYLALSAEMRGDRVYIVSTNAFDGILKQDGGRFLSTKRDGEGMGLRSVRAVAERWHGSMTAHAEGKTFLVDVVLTGERG